MQKKTITLRNPLGLHARASMKLIDAASRFQSRITVSNGKRNIDAKDILQVMALGATQNMELEIMTEGADEIEALAAIQKLCEEGFGEI